jgi:uncharacterized membrane protein HdeD (DUF308 family)
MSRQERVEAAKKLRSRCTAFKWMTIISGGVAILLAVAAAIAPPQWDVYPNMLKLIGEIMGIMGIFSALTAFESGRDAKLILGNHVTLGIDGDGDGKIGESKDEK